MDWRAPIRERARIAKGFALDLVICEQDDEAAAIPGGVSWDALADRAASPRNTLDLPAPAPDPLFLIAPSSGSTGAPKGLAVTHGNQLVRVVRLQMGLRFERDARCLSATPLVHASGRNKCIAMLIPGAR